MITSLQLLYRCNFLSVCDDIEAWRHPVLVTLMESLLYTHAHTHACRFTSTACAMEGLLSASADMRVAHAGLSTLCVLREREREPFRVFASPISVRGILCGRRTCMRRIVGPSNFWVFPP